MAALDTAFDDVLTKMMGEVYDVVCSKLHGLSYPSAVKEAIADRVIEITRGSSERDPERLAAAVIASLRIKV